MNALSENVKRLQQRSRSAVQQETFMSPRRALAIKRMHASQKSPQVQRRATCLAGALRRRPRPGKMCRSMLGHTRRSDYLKRKCGDGAVMRSKTQVVRHDALRLRRQA